MNIKEIKLGEYYIGFMLFVIVCSPSIKIIYSSMILNIMPLVAVLFYILVPRKITKINHYVTPTLYATCLIILLLFLVRFDLASYDSLKLLFILVTLFVYSLVINERILKVGMSFMVMWSLILSLLQLSSNISLNVELGQNYTTLATPIGLGLVIVSSLLWFSNSRIFNKIVFLVLSLLYLITLASLVNRSAILINILLINILFLAFLYNHKYKFRILFIYIVCLTAVGTLLMMYFDDLFSSYQVDRLERLIFNIENEPRVQIYQRAIDLIVQSPLWGYGSGNERAIFDGFYPHNIFLSILLMGGVVLFIPFTFIVICFLYECLSTFKASNKNTLRLALVSASLYLFFQWNLSAGVDSIHIPLIMMLSLLKVCGRSPRYLNQVHKY
jgi:O-antigen ligase